MLKRKENISLMKTISMIIVVFYHSMMFYSGNWFTVIKSPIVFNSNIFSIINNFQMPVFVFCSGYLYFYLNGAKSNEGIKKRVKRLIIPYIFTSILYVIPINIFFYNLSFKEIIIKFILGIGPSQLWFLLMLFWVYVIFYYILNSVKLDKKNLILISITCPLISAILSKFNIFQIGTAISYIPFYFLGGYIERNNIKFNNKFIYGIFVVLVNVLIIYLTGSSSLLIKGIIKYLQLFVSYLEVILFYLLSLRFRGTNSKAYKVIESNSFGIYLFHQQLIYFCLFITKGMFDPIFQILFNFFVSLLISLIITIILKKNKITKMMFGL